MIGEATQNAHTAGAIDDHRSHQSGRDVDIRLPLSEEHPPWFPIKPWRVDYQALWKLLEAFAALGLARMQIEQLESAESSLRQAIRLNEDYIPARLWLANLLGTQGRNQRCRAVGGHRLGERGGRRSRRALHRRNRANGE